MIRKLTFRIPCHVLKMIAFIALTGCYYHDDSNIIVDPVDNTQEISFATSVIPIFESNCAVTGCHVVGGHSPNLEANVAYDELFSNNLINTANPQTSELIIRMESASDPMPTSGPLSKSQINIIKNWISQGAKDN